MKILLLHAYSAANLGDGLLVTEALELLDETFGADNEIVVAASRPETFGDLGCKVIGSMPSKLGYNRDYIRLLMSINSFDLIVGVGGGYLRTGYLIEAAKMALSHGPQLIAASWSRKPTAYLPQSIGPSRLRTRAVLSRLLGGLDLLYVRDDRSMVEFAAAGAKRFPDMAIMAKGGCWPDGSEPVDPHPVLSIRALRRGVPVNVLRIGALLEDVGYDAYIQSQTGAGNNDVEATSLLNPQRVLDRHELMVHGAGPTRVVVAVRLHASLMALAAGHFVVHLAYERKGFGAFQDLGLESWVHNVNDFDPKVVHGQVMELLSDSDTRRNYASSVATSIPQHLEARKNLIRDLRLLVRGA